MIGSRTDRARTRTAVAHRSGDEYSAGEMPAAHIASAASSRSLSSSSEEDRIARTGLAAELRKNLSRSTATALPSSSRASAGSSTARTTSLVSLIGRRSFCSPAGGPAPARARGTQRITLRYITLTTATSPPPARSTRRSRWRRCYCRPASGETNRTRIAATSPDRLGQRARHGRHREDDERPDPSTSTSRQSS